VQRSDGPISPVVETRAVSKSFGDVRAVDRVSLAVALGVVHAIIGENGAGKTTLMRLLYGIYEPDEGTILVDGVPRTIRHPRDAIQLGIGMVHQHFMLVPSLTVADNVALGRVPRRGLQYDVARARADVLELAGRYGLKVDPSVRIQDLSVGQMQRVEIIKALLRGARVLILDEPTAVLTPQEVDELMEALRTLAAEGKSIIFISHKLREVLKVADRTTVMRGGRVVGEAARGELDAKGLARLMVGRDVLLTVTKPPLAPGPVALEVADLHVDGARGLPAVKGVSFQVHGSEIVGIAGVEGNGQSELVEALAGLRPIRQGSVKLYGRELTRLPPRQRYAAGLAHIPEDRLKRGVSTSCTIQENLMMRFYYRPPYSRGRFLNFSAISARVRTLMQRFDVRAKSPAQPTGALSGGNMQKLVIARELGEQPECLLAAQPTRGVDVGAIEYIHSQLLELRGRGKAILLISAELDEIRSLSDRILVMYEGTIVAEMAGEHVREEELGLAMAGHTGAGGPVADSTDGAAARPREPV